MSDHREIDEQQTVRADSEHHFVAQLALGVVDPVDRLREREAVRWFDPGLRFGLRRRCDGGNRLCDGGRNRANSAVDPKRILNDMAVLAKNSTPDQAAALQKAGSDLASMADTPIDAKLHQQLTTSLTNTQKRLKTASAQYRKQAAAAQAAGRRAPC